MESSSAVFGFGLKKHEPLFSLLGQGETWQRALRKAEDAETGKSSQKVEAGEKTPPFDFKAVQRMRTANTHHSSCLETKRDATTGLGFKNKETRKKLDALTKGGFLQQLNLAVDDYWQCGNGYIEVVRKGNDGEITFMKHIPCADVVFVMDDAKEWIFHYRIKSENGQDQDFAAFGLKDEFLGLSSNSGKQTEDVSEVIHFQRNSTLSRWYGVPDWLAAVPAVELATAIMQHNFDFFMNGGVPDLLLMFTGAQVPPKDWEAFKTEFAKHIGLGNTHKNMLANFNIADLKVEVHKLMAEGGKLEASFGNMLDTLALVVVSAHRVPPLLAGIQIPGKLGASNELPNALAAFQALVIGQAQAYIMSTLANTIGEDLSLEEEAFEFNTILDNINVAQMNEMATTRTPVGAKPEGDKSASPDQPRSAVDLEKMAPEEKGKLLFKLFHEVWSRVVDQAA